MLIFYTNQQETNKLETNQQRMNLTHFRTLIDEAIIANKYTAKPAELYDPINYIMALGGKRMRPSLVLMGTELVGGNVNEAIPAALAVEVFHNFTLVHDDIMDNAPLRRNQPTVHTKWNANIAILSGDVMLVKAYELLLKTNSPRLTEILNVFNQTATGVCEGQQMDMNFELRAEVSIAEYIEMIRLKTAVLLGGALEIGGLLANASEADALHLYNFGESIGIAFQLHDDLLDVYANPEKFGKQVGGDIIANKKTFLLIKALELATGEDALELQKWLSATEFDTNAKVKAITHIYNKLGIDTFITAEMNKYVAIGFEHLNAIKANNSKKEFLIKFVNELMVRET